jgi:hypothetical protein
MTLIISDSSIIQQSILILICRPGIVVTQQLHKDPPSVPPTQKADLKVGTRVQTVCSPLYPCFHVTEFHISIVSRMLSNIPSQTQQDIEFIRPMVEERFAKMEEYGEDWDDRLVCQTIVTVSDILLHG